MVTPDDCPTCAALVVTLTPGTTVTCPACGGELQRQHPRRSDTRARGKRSPPPDATPDRLVRAFVGELLSWDRAVASVEHAARGGASPLAGALQACELGVLGSGCRGTKGVGRAPSPEPSSLAVDPRLGARYQALPRPDRETAEAVMTDGQGDALVQVPLGGSGRVFECTLAQRVGLRLADTTQQIRWHTHLASGDSPPALEGAENLGRARLEQAARRWFEGAQSSCA